MIPGPRMDSALLCTFLLLPTLPWISSQSEPAVTVHCDYDEDPELRDHFLGEGESLRFVFISSNPKSNFTWYWNNSRDVLPLSTQQTQLVHAEGPTLYLLNATQALSGCFMAREKKSSGRIRDHQLLVSVEPPNSSKLVYGEMNFSGNSMIISCPTPVNDTCRKLNGTLSWYKDAVLLPNQESSHVIVSGALEKDQGLYTCVCTWKHRQHLYRSVGSRLVLLKKPSIAEVPVKILFPTKARQWVSAGDLLKLNCSVFCGINVPHHMCRAWWETKPSALNPERSNQTEVYSPKSSNSTIVTAVLTIAQVSIDDFQQQFVCFGRGPYDREEVSFTVHLKSRRKLNPPVLRHKSKPSPQSKGAGPSQSQDLRHKSKPSPQSKGTGPSQSQDLRRKSKPSPQSKGAGPSQSQDLRRKSKPSPQSKGTGPSKSHIFRRMSKPRSKSLTTSPSQVRSLTPQVQVRSNP